MSAQNGTNDDQGITLRDVINHMLQMEQRLSVKIDANATRIDENTAAIADLKLVLTQRIDALEEDLVATMKDTIRIREHVGMTLPSDD